MKYTDRILRHPIFQKLQEEIKKWEAGRIYCHHEMEHALDVARLSWIYYLEDMLSENMGREKPLDDKEMTGTEWTEALEEQKDLFYMAALLHDIGRVAQYETGVHHSVSGLVPARQILNDIEAPQDWISKIADVIAEHGKEGTDNQKKNLEYYIAKADHECRLCFSCEAKEGCKWPREERNHTVVS